MTDLNKTIVGLHERLTSLRDDIDGEFATLFAELEQAQGAIEQLMSEETGNDKRVKQLEERAEGQSELIETLTQEAQEAQQLRKEVRERDLSVAKLNSELDSKNDLVKALRRQLEDADKHKAKTKQQDKKIFEQQHQLDRKQRELDVANREIEKLKDELETESERAAESTVVDSAELSALKSELDARKSMIKSLKADAERIETLEQQLDEKRETINALEQAIDQHGETIEGLRQGIEVWREKYQAAKGEKIKDPDETVSELPAFTDTEVEVLKGLEAGGDDAPAATVAIDMRDALKEARRTKARVKS